MTDEKKRAMSLGEGERIFINTLLEKIPDFGEFRERFDKPLETKDNLGNVIKKQRLKIPLLARGRLEEDIVEVKGNKEIENYQKGQLFDLVVDLIEYSRRIEVYGTMQLPEEFGVKFEDFSDINTKLHESDRIEYGLIGAILQRPVRLVQNYCGCPHYCPDFSNSKAKYSERRDKVVVDLVNQFATIDYVHKICKR